MSNTIITPDTVESNDKTGLNYKTVIETFGCQFITSQILDNIRKLTNQTKLHPFFENDIFFAHRDLDKLLNECIANKSNNFYLYTGRGPSSTNLHLGHLVPFMATKYLQDIFDVPVIIQITDDEKYYFKNNDDGLNQYRSYAIENIKDIIACGFNPHKTFIFLNSTNTSHFSHNHIKIQKKIKLHHIKSTFGYTDDDNMGRVSFPTQQMTPSFATSFPHLLSNQYKDIPTNPLDNILYQLSEPIYPDIKDMKCVIIAAVDQDPYFRTLRNIAPKIKEHQPIVIYSKFLASLQGKNNKMSASVNNSAIFLTDTPKQIKKKINSFAFSGGQETLELHREIGGNTDVDVAFQYIQYFSDNVNIVQTIKEQYTSGELLTGELKKTCISILTDIVLKHQEIRNKITMDDLKQFMTPRFINQS